LARRELEVQVARARADESAASARQQAGAAAAAGRHDPYHERERARAAAAAARQEREAAAAREREMAQIRAAYLRDPQAGSKRVAGHARPSERNKFKFEWGADEDTTAGADPYFVQQQQQQHGRRGYHERECEQQDYDRRGSRGEGRSGYGDGGLGAASGRQHQHQLPSSSRGGGGGGGGGGGSWRDPLLMDEPRRSGGSNGAPAKEHWATKNLRDMTERDWRIFREDFNIAYKSLRGDVKPLRSWNEAQLPPELVKVRRARLLYRRRRRWLLSLVERGLFHFVSALSTRARAHATPISNAAVIAPLLFSSGSEGPMWGGRGIE